MHHPHREMVGKIGTDPRQIVYDLDADRLQMAGRADARNLQQLRRIDGTAAYHDLTRRGDTAVTAVLPEGDPGAAPPVEQQPRRDRLGLDPQVGAAAGPRPEMCVRSTRETVPAVSSASTRPLPGPCRCNRA